MEFESKNTFVAASQIHAEFCPLDTTIKIISGRWKSIIINRLMNSGELHFNELARRIPNCTRRMLALQLRELTDAQVIARKVETDQSPLHISYELTELGRELVPLLLALNRWGENYIRQVAKFEGELETSCK